jgi:hypothetical protein
MTITSEINSIPLCILNLGASIFTIVFGRSMDGSWLMPCGKWSKNQGYRGSMIDEPVAHCIRKKKIWLDSSWKKTEDGTAKWNAEDS